jgi:hypothetical protein
MGGYVMMVGEENPLEGAAADLDPGKAFAMKLPGPFLIVSPDPDELRPGRGIFAIVFATVGRSGAGSDGPCRRGRLTRRRAQDATS